MSQIESAPYEVLSSNEKYEVRVYPEQKWVTTYSTLDSDKLFWKCYGYINGKNDQDKKISMTSPVTCTMDKRGNSFINKSMSFYVPKQYQDGTPNPTGDNITIEERPKLTVFVRRYGGYSSDAKVEENLRALKSDLTEDKQKFKEDTFYYAGYDSPMKFWGRRNEVWILKDESG